MYSLIINVERKSTIEETLLSLDHTALGAEAEKRPVILRGIFTEDNVRAIREFILDEFKEYKTAPDSRYYVGCPNVYKALSRDYYYYRPERRHLWNYFLWNRKKDHAIYQIGLPFTRFINLLAGLPMDYGHDPKCGHFYTLSAMCYPKGGGFLAPHVDSYAQKYQALLTMTKLGEDFEEGGLYCFDADNNNHYLEPELERGDLLLLPSIVVHGVYPIDPRSPSDDKFAGRWAFFTPMPQSKILADGPGVSKPITLDDHIPRKM